MMPLLPWLPWLHGAGFDEVAPRYYQCVMTPLQTRVDDMHSFFSAYFEYPIPLTYSQCMRSVPNVRPYLGLM